MVSTFSDETSFSFRDPLTQRIVGRSEIRAVDSSDFFRSRFQSTVFNGAFLDNNNLNEIVINSELSGRLNLDEPLGKTIQIMNDNGRIQDLLIVGMTSKKTAFNKQLSFVNFQMLNNLQSQTSTNAPFILQPSTNGLNFLNNLNFRSVTSLDMTTELSAIAGIQGHLPENQGEILFPESEYQKLRPSEQDALKNAINNNLSFTLESNSNWPINPPIKITGIYQSNSVELKARLQDITFWSAFRALHHQIYLEDFNQVNAFETALHNLTNNLRTSNNLNQFSDLINNSVDQTNFILQLAFIVLIIITLLFVLLYSKFLADSKAKDTGILKSLGASVKFVSFFHLTNIFLVSIASFVLSIILYFPLEEIFKVNIPNFFLLNVDTGAAIGIIIGIWLAISIVASLLYYFIGLVYFKKRTIKLLKK